MGSNIVQFLIIHRFWQMIPVTASLSSSLPEKDTSFKCKEVDFFHIFICFQEPEIGIGYAVAIQL